MNVTPLIPSWTQKFPSKWDLSASMEPFVIWATRLRQITTDRSLTFKGQCLLITKSVFHLKSHLRDSKPKLSIGSLIPHRVCERISPLLTTNWIVPICSFFQWRSTAWCHSLAIVAQFFPRSQIFLISRANVFITRGSRMEIMWILFILCKTCHHSIVSNCDQFVREGCQAY